MSILLNMAYILDFRRDGAPRFAGFAKLRVTFPVINFLS